MTCSQERHADIKHLLTPLLLRRQKVYNAIATPLEAPLITHAHGQHAFFPNLDAKAALQDVQREYQLPRHGRVLRMLTVIVRWMGVQVKNGSCLQISGS